MELNQKTENFISSGTFRKRSRQKAALLTGTGGGVIEVSAVAGRSQDSMPRANCWWFRK